MKRCSRPLVLLLTFLPTPALCAEVPTMGSMLLKMTWALLIVAGLILILYGILRKRMGVPSAGGNIRILEVKPVMYRNSIALIEVHGREMLVAINQSGVRLLTEFPSSGSPSPSFKETLRQEQ